MVVREGDGIGGFMAERVDPSWQLWYDIYDLVNDDDEIAQEEIDCIMDQAEGYRFVDASIYCRSTTNQV